MRDRADAEALDRALSSPGATPPAGLAALARLAEDLMVAWGSEPAAEPAAYGRRVALATFRNAVAHGRRTPRVRTRLRVATTVAAVVALLAGGTAATVAVQRAVPGDVAYPAKLVLERTRHVLAVGDAAEASLYLAQAESRVEEAVRAQSLGRTGALPETLGRYRDDIHAFQERLTRVDAERAAALEARAVRELRTHEEVLKSLLNVVPAEARPGIERAIEATRRAGPPEGAGPPEDAGAPEDAGPPDERGPPGGSGPPATSPPGAERDIDT
jgi:hypothetical protein